MKGNSWGRMLFRPQFLHLRNGVIYSREGSSTCGSASVKLVWTRQHPSQQHPVPTPPSTCDHQVSFPPGSKSGCSRPQTTF